MNPAAAKKNFHFSLSRFHGCVRGLAGQLFVRFLYYMYCLHKNVDMTRTFVRVIGKVPSYIKRALPT